MCDTKITKRNRRLVFYNGFHSRTEYICKRHVFNAKLILDDRHINGVYMLISHIDRDIQQEIIRLVAKNDVYWYRKGRYMDWGKTNGIFKRNVFDIKIIFNDECKGMGNDITFMIDKIDTDTQFKIIDAVINNIVYFDTRGELGEEAEEKS